MKDLTTMESTLLSFEQNFNSVNAYKMNFKKEANFAHQILNAKTKAGDFLLQTAIKNPESLKNAITNIAAVGISLNPAQKEAYLVPRGGQVCLDISYVGLIKLATDSGAVEWVQAEIVKEKDEFEFLGVGKAPLHKMNPFGDRGKMIGAYCIARLFSGEYLSTIMSKAEIDTIRDKSSQAAKYGPWVDFYEEMSKKTVIKRASKLWPKSERIQNAVNIINEHEGINFQDKKEIEPTPENIAKVRTLLEEKNKTDGKERSEEFLLAHVAKVKKLEETPKSIEDLKGETLSYCFELLGGKP